MTVDGRIERNRRTAGQNYADVLPYPHPQWAEFPSEVYLDETVGGEQIEARIRQNF